MLAEKSGVIGYALCGMGFHSWSRWQKMPGYVIEGRSKRELTLQIHECVRPSCGYSQKEVL